MKWTNFASSPLMLGMHRDSLRRDRIRGASAAMAWVMWESLSIVIFLPLATSRHRQFGSKSTLTNYNPGIHAAAFAKPQAATS